MKHSDQAQPLDVVVLLPVIRQTFHPAGGYSAKKGSIFQQSAGEVKIV
jgi:hypothetical protein